MNCNIHMPAAGAQPDWFQQFKNPLHRITECSDVVVKIQVLNPHCAMEISQQSESGCGDRGGGLVDDAMPAAAPVTSSQYWKSRQNFTCTHQCNALGFQQNSSI